MNQSITLAIWAIATLIIGIVGAQLSWRSLPMRMMANSLVGELLAFAHKVGLPFAALIFGVLGQDLIGLGRPSPNSLLGFVEGAWVAGLMRVALAVTAVAAILWLMGREQAKVAAVPSPLTSLRDTLYDEAHWAFYFSAGTLWFNDAYWGVLIGISLIVLETLLHPRLRNQLVTQHGRQHLLLRSLCLLCIGLLYAGPQNLWLMLLGDAAIRLTGPYLLQPARQSRLQS